MAARCFANLVYSLMASRKPRWNRLARMTQLRVEQLEYRCLPAITTLANLMDAPGGASPQGPLIVDSSGNLFGTTMRGGAFGQGTVFKLPRGGSSVITLASFNGSDGAQPHAGLVEDSSGDLFGTTSMGGAYDLGTVFELPKGSYTIRTLVSFNGFNGAYPAADLTIDSSGNLLGVAGAGGPGWNGVNGNNSTSTGVIFEIAKGSETFTVVAALDADNAFGSFGSLAEDSNGNMFGTSQGGGEFLNGSVYEVQKGSSTVITIASFDGANGNNPAGTLILDSSGDLFGVTTEGGSANGGTIFEIPKGSTTITTLVNFNSATGTSPSIDLYVDSGGNFFGTTNAGGTYDYGTVFELPHGSETLSTLASFADWNIGSETGVVEDSTGNIFGAAEIALDCEGSIFELPKGSSTPTSIATFAGVSGNQPRFSLAEDNAGNLYGTASGGGAFNDGTVFEVHKDTGALTVLAAFNGANGLNPECDLVVDSSGNLYGTTVDGGAFNSGTVFEVAAGSGTITTLVNFDVANGATPDGPLLEDSSGNLFGTTSGGGAGGGTVFELPLGSNTISTLTSFTSSVGAGSGPDGLVEDASGNLFGTTAYGGPQGGGVIFEIPRGGSMVVLAPFLANGLNSPNGLSLDSKGNLYGTTIYGPRFPNYYGGVFELPKGSSTILTLASFDSQVVGGPDVVIDSSGNVFGTTYAGGAYDDGTLFETKPGSGTLTTVVSFNGIGEIGPDSLIEDSAGDIFGTTLGGGTEDDGMVFEIPVALPDGTAGFSYNQTIPASGGPGSFTFAETGALPIGLTLSTTGVLAGTPTSAGSYTFTVTATDSLGTKSSHDYSLTINPGPFTQFLVSLGSSSTVQAGSDFLVDVQNADRFGNPVSNYYVSPNVSVSPGSPGSSFPTSVNFNSSGSGLFLATLQQPGSYTIAVSFGSINGSARVTVAPGPPTKLSFASQPSSSPTGDKLPAVTVQVEDLYGNIVTSDNSDTVTLGIAAGPGSFTSGSTLTATVQNGVATFSNLTLVTPGLYQLSAVVPGLYTGPNSASFSILPLQVAPGSFQGTPSGFSLQFNAPFLVNAVTPALYGSGAAVTPTVTLTQTSGTPPAGATLPYAVPGSLLVDPTSNTLTFVETDTSSLVANGTPLLPDGVYVVDVSSSGANGLQALNRNGGYLDCTGSGTPGQDFTATFTVGAAAAGEDVLWVPATADGPGQALSAPGKNQLGDGYPVYLDDQSGSVTDVQTTLSYNPTLLTVTPSSTATFTVTVPGAGTALVHYHGPALPAGTQTAIGFLTTSVPAGTASNPVPYKAKDLLVLSGVSLNGGPLAAVGAEAVHLVAYVGDADGNGAYTSNDAVLITRVALQTDSGFAAYPLVDPVIVADTDGAGFLPADAALQVNEAGVGLPTGNLPVPPIPGGVVFQTVVNHFDLRAAWTVRRDGQRIMVVSVNLDDVHPASLTRGPSALTDVPTDLEDALDSPQAAAPRRRLPGMASQAPAKKLHFCP